MIVHDRILNHQCKKCSRHFGRKYELKEHIDFVHKKMKFDCEECSSMFTNARALRCHTKKKHPSTTTLNYHKKVKHPDIEHHCDYCTMKFTSKSNIKQHVETLHSEFTISKSNPTKTLTYFCDKRGFPCSQYYATPALRL